MLEEKLMVIQTRIDELEQRETFHELTIETLNTRLIEQSRQIEALEVKLTSLSNKISKEFDDFPISLTDERPPHY